MEQKIRKAFDVADELAKKAPVHFYRDVFSAVFHSMLAGSFAGGDAIPSDDSITKAINNLSANTAKWLSVIAQAITADQTDQEAINALRDRLKAETDKLQTAVNAAS